MLFRVAMDEDLQFISELSAELFSKYGDYDEIVAGWFLEPGIITVVAVERDRLQGFAMLTLDRQRMFDSRRGHLLAIGVSTQHQRKGIGSALLKHMEDLALKYGSTEMRLWTAAENTQGLSFFEKCGFEIIGSNNHFYPKGQAALALTKKLNP